MGVATAPAGLTLETISSEGAFATLDVDEWDTLVRSTPRPSPFLLHGWLREWWQHHGEDGELAVHVAYRDGRLVGALPLCVRPRYGMRVLSFVGGDDSSLADVLVADGERPELASALVDSGVSSGHDFAEFSGLSTESRLVATVGPSRLSLVERSEAPVLDLTPGWQEVYASKLSSKKRNHYRRRRRQLAEAGRVDVEVARTEPELDRALEDAFMLHDLRWEGRPDGSGFATPVGRASSTRRSGRWCRSGSRGSSR